ncbi:peptidylprolyl isomerase [Paucisalibacillus globulus]|uniref:peptidylprolyl isomerase n=1 Tax=Paucisalibacillus globulus TaxID=351095 RepID=UPI00159686D1|nr:peptidylprolyl isomerase [Paucisalibacillus globulus]
MEHKLLSTVSNYNAEGVKGLRKIFVLVFLLVLILSACNSSKLSFSEIENVPNNVQDKVDSNLKLQSITDGGKGYYIVFHSSGDVETDLETQGDTVTIKINVTNLQDDVLKQNTYYLTTGPEPNKIDVLVNGESIPFDNVTIQ